MMRPCLQEVGHPVIFNVILLVQA